MGPNSALSEKLCDAVAAGDAGALREICAPGMQWIQNGAPAVDLEALIRTSLAVRDVLVRFRYANAMRSDTADGFVEEHEVRGTLPDGTECCISACIVARVEGGRVTALREYFDTVAAAGLRKALSA